MASSTARGSNGTVKLRADAARNRVQVLAAARTAFRELGTAAPLDEIARRAGVNIATLYRRFPDRDALIRQVVVDGFTLVLQAAQTALQSAEQDPLGAIEDYLLRVVDQRDLIVLPLAGGPVTDDPEANTLQGQIAATLDELIATARAKDTIRTDVTAVDLTITSALICRPMPYLSAEDATALVTRHARIFIDGLAPGTARSLPTAPPYEGITSHRLSQTT
ncbi:TetR/AcrR family transcriptional regulator [Streptomyces sp. NPDC048291]|uniref:TetR/AcrR family transcriptional regulator n=1 Tax=Streptomyces sp. NPDC048291 TaxID=3365530 RepID=UPI00372058CA